MKRLIVVLALVAVAFVLLIIYLRIRHRQFIVPQRYLNSSRVEELTRFSNYLLSLSGVDSVWMARNPVTHSWKQVIHGQLSDKDRTEIITILQRHDLQGLHMSRQYQVVMYGHDVLRASWTYCYSPADESTARLGPYVFREKITNCWYYAVF
jgi:hypothetical protein